MRFRWLAVLVVCVCLTVVVPAAADEDGPRPGPSVGLALGSGGLAHIAMLRDFDELRIRLLHFNRIEKILAGAQPEADRLRRRLREWTAAA